MKRFNGLAVVLPTLALVLGFGIVLTMGDGPNQHIQQDPPDRGECICTHEYAPVKCARTLPNGLVEIRRFTNACEAGCAGFTECRPI